MRTIDEVPALRVTGVSKRYPGVTALDGVSITVRSGQIVALAGANGAGKSTLVKILSGAEQPDEGVIQIDGSTVTFGSPHEARSAGIYTIFQEMSLVPTMSVLENIFLDDFVRPGVVHVRRLEGQARSLLDRLGLHVELHAPVGSLSLAQQQLVEIAKALKTEPRVLLLDEPTTTLGPRDVANLLSLTRELARDGVGLVYISHRMDELTEACDSVYVLRDGRRVQHFESMPAHHAIVRAMVGDRYEHSLAAAAAEGADGRLGGAASTSVVLEADSISDGRVLAPCTFTLRSGEILGITGLLGSGQTELGETIFGLRAEGTGTIRIDGRSVRISSPRHAIRAGIGLIPEDRKTQGLVLGMSTQKNMTLASLPRFSRFGLVDHRGERRHAHAMVDDLRIKCYGVTQPTGTMSGGNQQKVLLARWLTRRSKVLVLLEPTRGVDVAAKEEIYRLIRTYLRDGGSAILVSSEVAEAALCDRVLVLSSGAIVAEARHEEIQSHRSEFLAHLK